MGVIPIVNENDTLAVAVRNLIDRWKKEQQLKVIRKSNSVTMTLYPQLQRPWLTRITSSL